MDYKRTFTPWLSLMLALILSIPGSAQPETARRTDYEPAFVPGELIVLLADGDGAPTPEEVVESYRQGLRPLVGAGVDRPIDVKLALVHRAHGKLREMIEAAPESPRARLERYLLLTFPENANLDAIQAALERAPHVLHVEKNYLFKFAVSPSDPLFSVTGNPPDYQWGIHALNLPSAWDYSKGHGYVGLIDTGLQVNHPDLRPFADDQVTYLGGNFRPHLSWDFQGQDQSVDEREIGRIFMGHGTHVAGIVAANTNNGIGVAGACWNCSVLMTRGVERSGVESSQAANGLTWLVDHGVQAVSMSFGENLTCDPPSTGLGFFCDALELAHLRDVLMTAAPGNDKLDIEFPASDLRVLSVGGIEPTGVFWDRADEGEGCPCNWTSRPDWLSTQCNNGPATYECGSNYTLTPGTAPQDLVAPAKQVLSTFYERKAWNDLLGCHDTTINGVNHAGVGFDVCTGTSMSSPYVAAIAGILRSVNPLLSKAQIESALIGHASRAANWDPHMGYGVPDTSASVQAVLGRANGVVLPNRLTPLFSMFSPIGEDYFYTTVPQMGAAAYWRSPAYYYSVGPDVPGYGYFPGAPCQVGPCPSEPGASVYIFTTDRSPNGHPLVPLYRMTFEGTFQGGPSNPDNRDTTYTTETAGIQTFREIGYELDGIEGYIFQRCSPDPSCIPAGAVRLYRRYNPVRDDHAIFPESELAAMQADGYTQVTGNSWIGYVYPNVDSDFDHLINGFEDLTGTDPSRADSDCDSLSDGSEILGYPPTDPLVANTGPGCVPPKRAELVNQSVPTTMLPGGSYPVSMTWKNMGSLTWSPVGPQCGAYRLGTANSNTWGISGGRVELPGAVASGQQVTLNFMVTAPATPETYDFQWRMVHECVEWFDDTSPNVRVTVGTQPTALFTFTCTQLSCSLNASASTDDIGIASYSWSFGDSTSGSGAASNHAFGTTGTYKVTLTVTDTQGLQSSTSKNVSVNGEASLPAESFFPMSPCRLVDTRNTTPLTHGQIRVFNVSGSCGVPSTAKAVSLNATVVSPTGNGNLVFYPGDQTSSSFVSSLINFAPATSPRANNGVLRLATNGMGTVAVLPYVFQGSPAQVHLILDVNGYFGEDSGGLGYQTLPLCRLHDTNTSTPVAAGVIRSFDVDGLCGIPSGTPVGALNLTIVTPTEGGFATLFQAGTPVPPVSTINFMTGTFALANGARTQLAGAGQDISLQYAASAGSTTRVILSTYGYFSSGAPLKYRPITPCRAIDTRFTESGGPILTAGQVRNFQIQGNCGVPVGAKAAMLNIVAITPSGQGNLVSYASGTSAPADSILNFHPSQGNLANGTIVPLSTNANDLSLLANFNNTHVVVDVFGYFQ